MSGEKRRTSARIKAETPKKIALTDGKKPTPAKATPTKTSSRRKSSQSKAQAAAQEEPEEEQEPEPEPEPEPELKPLPVKISDGEALPTVENHLVADSASLKSIAESGVLAASLQRSQTKWLAGGFFEKYWTKPTKKKNQPEITNNPTKDTMSKVGQCSLYIDPHIFDVTLFTIKDPSLKASAKMQNQNATSAAGTPSQQQSGAVQPTPAESPAPASASAPTPPAAPAQPSPQPSTTLARSTQSTSAPVSHQTRPSQSLQDQTAPSVQSIGTQPTVQDRPADPPPTPQTSVQRSGGQQYSSQPSGVPGQAAPSTSHAPTTTPNQDPVIQMLAQRASTSPELKILMKIVASGNATHEQLRVFQSHIDDLTAILQRQRQAENPAPSRPYPSQTQPSGLGSDGGGSKPTQTQDASQRPPSKTPVQGPPTYPPLPGKSKSYTLKHDIIGVAIEFNAGSSDRYLFPKNAILEYLPHLKQVVASFLIVRKGETINDDRHNNATDYYEPVTVRFSLDHPKVMETLFRAVAPYEEARKYMEETMAKATRAKAVHLALRLPREEADENGQPDGGGGQAEAEQKPARGVKPVKQPSFWDLHCQFCYALLSAAQIRNSRVGERACQVCAALSKGAMAARGGRPAAKHAGQAPQQRASGQAALML